MRDASHASRITHHVGSTEGRVDLRAKHHVGSRKVKAANLDARAQECRINLN